MLKQEPKQETNPITPSSLMKLARQEFKISGQIGEPGQKDKLSFSSLAHQIENGRLKGHSERVIVLALPSLRQVLGPDL